MEKVSARKLNLTSESPVVQGLIDQYNQSGYVYARAIRVGVCKEATELTILGNAILATVSDLKDQHALKELARKVSDAIEEITRQFCTTYYNLPKATLIACHVSQKHTETLTEALSVRDKLYSYFKLKKEEDSWKPHPFWQESSITKDPWFQASQIDPTSFLAKQLEVIHEKLPFRPSAIIKAFESLFGPVPVPLEKKPDDIDFQFEQNAASQKARWEELLEAEERRKSVQRSYALYGNTPSACRTNANHSNFRPLQPQLRHHFVGSHQQSYWG